MKLKLTMTKAVCDQEMFDALLEYSTSIPTGMTPGKRWKRETRVEGAGSQWFLGEYYLPHDPAEVAAGYISIRWRNLTVVEEFA